MQIGDCISPTIIERLEQQTGILKLKIDDRRAMVDYVMIDPAYDGQVFNVALADVPEKKTDLVTGKRIYFRDEIIRRNNSVMLFLVNVTGRAVLVSSKLGPLTRSEFPIPQEGPLLGLDLGLFGFEACSLFGIE